MVQTSDSEALARLKAVWAAQASLAEAKDAAREADRQAANAHLAVSEAEAELSRACDALDLPPCRNGWRNA